MHWHNAYLVRNNVSDITSFTDGNLLSPKRVPSNVRVASAWDMVSRLRISNSAFTYPEPKMNSNAEPEGSEENCLNVMQVFDSQAATPANTALALTETQ